MGIRVSNYQVKNFYIDKRPHPPVTDAYIRSGFGQTRGGYINFAKECFYKGQFKNPRINEKNYQLQNYRRILDYVNNQNDIYDLNFLESIKDIKILDIDSIDKNDAEPNQKWHLYVSLFAQAVVGDESFKWDNHFKKYPSLQLKLWMAEEVGIDVSYILQAIKRKIAKIL